MTTALEQVRALSDFQAVRLVEHLSDVLAEDIDVDELLQTTPRELLDAGIKRAPAMANRVGENLSPEDSVAVARVVLNLLASDSTTAPIVTDALATIKDAKMFAAEILSLGAAMSMVIIACTTTFRYRGKKLDVAKGPATPELVKTVGKVFVGSAAGQGG